jgi:uncharacterized protein (TIGR02246 family)
VREYTEIMYVERARRVDAFAAQRRSPKHLSVASTDELHASPWKRACQSDNVMPSWRLNRMSEADDLAIGRILADQENAWAAGDARGFSKHMADEFLATNVQGQSISGKERFDRAHEFIFGSFYRGSKMTQTIGTLRYTSDTTACVETVVKVSDLTDPLPIWPLDSEGRLETRLLQVLTKSAGSWSVVAYHNTIVNHRAPPLPA